MAIIYLHIGMPKTGSSHLQRILWLNEKFLMKNGYVFPHFETFPRIGRGRNGHFLRYKYFKENGERDYRKEEQLIRHNFDILSAMKDNDSRFILSEEGLWNAGEKIWTNYMEESQKRGFETRVIVYLRRQDLFLQSYWAQKVKEYSEETFEEFFDHESYKSLNLDYYANLERLSSYVGKENIIVRVYEDGQYEGREGNLTSDFFKALGIETDEDLVVPDYHYNPSLNGIYLEVKRLLNHNPQLAVAQSFVKDLLVELMKEKGEIKGFDSASYFTGDRQKKLMDRFEDSNIRINAEYLHREDGKLFMEPLGKSEGVHPVYSVRELMDVCAELLLIQEQKHQKSMDDLHSKLEQKDKVIARKQEVIDWETTPFAKKVVRKLKKVAGKLRP